MNCGQVVADDYEIDILEKQVDLDGVNLLVRFHPVASDMREVISAMKSAQVWSASQTNPLLLHGELSA
jgi:phosphate uptake regulator